MPVIRARKDDPRDDLISVLWQHGPRILMPWTEDEVLAQCRVLFFAGADTTAHFLRNAIYVLMTQPHWQSELRGNEVKIQDSVDEVLRYYSPVHFRVRVAIKDVEVGGRLVRAGDRLHPMNAAANRDPRHYEHPDSINPRRKPLRREQPQPGQQRGGDQGSVKPCGVEREGVGGEPADAAVLAGARMPSSTGRGFGGRRRCRPGSPAMLEDPWSLPGLSDGGAHVGSICGGSFPTTLLQHWTRDRARGTVGLEFLIQRQCRDTAAAAGLADRGVLASGYRADLNVIDLDGLRLRRPEVHHDPPAACGGCCSGQKVTGTRSCGERKLLPTASTPASCPDG
jgi:Cytochrome P450/Amidohydrolase family